MLFAIWNHLYNFNKNKNTRAGVLLLVKSQALAKSRNASHMSNSELRHKV